MITCIANFLTGQNIHFIEKFDRENIDGQHLKPPGNY